MPEKSVAKRGSAPPRRQARVSDRPAAIMPVSAEGAYIRMLIYGDPGVGKSVLAGRSPNALMLVNDPDETSSMFLHGSTADRWHIQDYNDLTEAHDYLLHGGTKDYDWVWLDNATLMQEQGMDQIMADLVAAKPHRNQWIPDKAEYGENQNRLGALIRNFKSLPINLGIVAHAERFEDDDGKVVYKPMFQGGQGKFSDKICGYMGCVFYMSAAIKDGEKQRILLTDKRSKYMAKDRYSTYASGRVINPDMPVMLDQIAAARKRQQEAEKAATTKTTKKAPAKRVVTKRSA